MKKRRILSLFLAGLMLVGLAGYSSQAGADSEPVKFTLWHSYVGADMRAPFMDEILKKFSAEYPDIKIVEEQIPRDQYQTKLKTLAAAGQLPDAFVLWPNAMTQEFAKAGLLADINDLLEQNPDWKNSFVAPALKEFTVGGKTYSAGIGVSVTSIVYYNKALFAKYKLAYPKTYKQLLNVVKVFKKNGVIPITLGNKPKWPAQSTIFSLMANRRTGSEWLDNVLSKKGAKFTDKQFVAALKDLKTLTDLGAFNKDYNSLDNVQMRDYFYRGQAAMMIDGSWALTDMISKAPDALKKNIEMGVLPAFEGGKGDPNVMSGVSATGIVVSAKASPKQKEAIKKLIKFVTDKNAQQLYVKSSIPVSFKNVDIDPGKVDPLFAKLVDLIKKHPFVTVYDSALNSEQTEIINNGLQAVMMGMQKPEDLAKQLQAAVK
jgi:raffinose/stachyose/melibiose transport system substrate-binding protein